MTSRRDRGTILPIAMILVIILGMIAVGIASYAAAALRTTSVSQSRISDTAAAEGAMRIALEDIRSPRRVGDGRTTLGSTTVTSATAGFRAQDAGKGIAGTGILVGSTIVSVVNSTTVTISDAATVTATGVTIAYGNAICGPIVTTLLSTTINGIAASVQCVRQPSVPGEYTPTAVVITKPDGLVIVEDTASIQGDVYFAYPPTTLAKKLKIDDGDVWYPSATCPGTPPSIGKLTFENPDEHGYLCATTSVADKWSNLFAVPILKAVPTTAPAPITIGSGATACKVFSPGRYGSGYQTKPALNAPTTKSNYFKSGVYYFDNVGDIVIKDATVTGGQPGAAPASNRDETLWNQGCQNAAIDPLVNDTGTGVTFVLGGDSKITLDDKGSLELFQPINNGYSVVAYSIATNPDITGAPCTPLLCYAASDGGSLANPLVDQGFNDHGLMRIHGGVWAPEGFVRLGKEINPSDKTEGLVASKDGQLLGGVIVGNLTLKKKAPPDGYNLKVSTLPSQYRVLVTATAGEVTVRAVADVRPSGEELALRSWQVTDDASIATPSAPLLIGMPLFTPASDTGTADDGITKLAQPTFRGNAATGLSVELYNGDTLLGTATSIAGVYNITTSALPDGDYVVFAVATDATGDTTASAESTFSVDTTPPVVAAAGAAIAPTTNSTTQGFVKQGGQYYVYANASDLLGVSSIKADVSALTTGQTAVTLVPGLYTMGGVEYLFRSDALTANATITAGVKTYPTTATDAAGNSATTSPAENVTVDNTAPTGAVTVPTAFSVLSSMQTLTANSADATSGVYSAEFQHATSLGGPWTTIGTVTTAPYTMTWDTSGLNASNYYLRVVTVDNASNTFTSANVAVVAPPPGAPAAPVLDVTSDSGTIGDNITADDTPTFSGTGVPGNTLKLYEGATLKGTGTIAVDGTWSVTALALSQAAHTITATQTNTSGVVSPTSGGVTVTIDKTDPTIGATDAVIASASNTTTDGYVHQGGQYYVYGKATDAGSGISGLTANVNAVTTGATAVPMTAGSWVVGGVTYSWRSAVQTATTPLAAGSKNFTVTATDGAGNTKATPNIVVVVDNTAPTGSITAPSNGSWTASSTTVTSNSNDAASVGWADFQYSPAGAGSWTSIAIDTASPFTTSWNTSGLSDGSSYDLRVVTTDSAGNTFTSATVTVTVDRTAPASPSTPVLAVASDTGVAGDRLTKVTTPTFTGTAEAGSTVKLYDGATLVGSGTATGGSYSIATSAMTAAAHTITATATDPAGNASSSSGSVVVTIETTQPTITGAVLENGGVLAKIDTGDTGVITFSEQMNASTFCSIWTDNSNPQTLTNATVTIVDDGGTDTLVITTASCTWGSIGTWMIGDYIGGSGGVFVNSTVTWDPVAHTITLTIGTLSSGSVKSAVPKKANTVAGNAGRTDIAGNALVTALYTHPSTSGF